MSLRTASLLAALAATPAVAQVPIGVGPDAHDAMHGDDAIAADPATGRLGFVASGLEGADRHQLLGAFSDDGGKDWKAQVGPLDPRSAGYQLDHPSAALLDGADGSVLAWVAPMRDGHEPLHLEGQGLVDLDTHAVLENHAVDPEGRPDLVAVSGLARRGAAEAWYATVEDHAYPTLVLRARGAAGFSPWQMRAQLPLEHGSAGVPARDLELAFDPSGQVGWVAYLSEKGEGPRLNVLRSQDGGETWEDMDAPELPLVSAELDLTVDAAGEAHVLVAIKQLGALERRDAVVLADLTRADDGSWEAPEVARVRSLPAPVRSSDPGLHALQGYSLQIARDEKGEHVFYAWVSTKRGDDDRMLVLNRAPDLSMAGLRLEDGRRTGAIAITGGGVADPSLDGRAHWPDLAAEVVERDGQYHLPIVVTRLMKDDAADAVEYLYLGEEAVIDPADFLTERERPDADDAKARVAAEADAEADPDAPVACSQGAAGHGSWLLLLVVGALRPRRRR